MLVTCALMFSTFSEIKTKYPIFSFVKSRIDWMVLLIVIRMRWMLLKLFSVVLRQQLFGSTERRLNRSYWLTTRNWAAFKHTHGKYTFMNHLIQCIVASMFGIQFIRFELWYCFVEPLVPQQTLQVFVSYELVTVKCLLNTLQVKHLHCTQCNRFVSCDFWQKQPIFLRCFFVIRTISKQDHWCWAILHCKAFEGSLAEKCHALICESGAFSKWQHELWRFKPLKLLFIKSPQLM